MDTVDQIIAGLSLLKVYGSLSTWAEHDEFGCGGVPPDILTEAERNNLEEWGWRWNSHLYSWEIFT